MRPTNAACSQVRSRCVRRIALAPSWPGVAAPAHSGRRSRPKGERRLPAKRRRSLDAVTSACSSPCRTAVRFQEPSDSHGRQATARQPRRLPLAFHPHRRRAVLQAPRVAPLLRQRPDRSCLQRRHRPTSDRPRHRDHDPQHLRPHLTERRGQDSWGCRGYGGRGVVRKANRHRRRRI